MMIRRFAAPLVALAAVAATSAFAQDPGAPPAAGGGRGQGGAGGGRGQGGGQGRGGFGGGMFGMQQDVSLATAPVNALAKALKLEDAQKTQIGEIQQALREQQQTQMREAFQGLQGGGGGGGFDPQAMQEMRTQMQDKAKAANSKASKAIEALLTDDQKTAWPAVKKTWDIFQKAGLNIELGEALNLTEEQMKALAAYAKNRPQGGPGGPGGGRGFGGG